MKFGAVFPHTEIEAEPHAIRRWVRGVAELGIDHVLVFDHVVGVDTDVHPSHAERAHGAGAASAKPYDVHDPFHEAMVLLGFIAGMEVDLDVATGILVLPQRQTALVAKQAAEIDVLTGGRLRLGVGIGWNALEQRALGRDFHRRGDVIDEQIGLLRSYWTDTTVRFDGQWDWADGVGICPMPVQRPIPVWLAGGKSARALRRVGSVADGWLPVSVDPTEIPAQRAMVDAAATAAGRDPSAIGLQGRISNVDDRDADRAARLVDGWREVGATHVGFDTMRSGLVGVDRHLAALEVAAGAAGL